MKIALIGYGKMGKEIEQQALSTGHQILLCVDAHSKITIKDLKYADVAIEFTQPNAVIKNIQLCFDANVPIVVGTTGWYNELEKIIAQCNLQKQALIYASNFSIGVNLFFELNKILARMMNNYDSYDVSIEETHHKQKLDTPSGTAITLAEQIIEELKRKSKWSLTPDKAQQLLINSYREDDVTGNHSVIYTSTIDSIEIKHTAHNRKGFAQGALLAAEWLIGKQGVFTMKDALFHYR